MINSRETPNRHPLFPNPSEATISREKVFSDHLPILVNTKIGSTKKVSLNLLSLNVLGPSTFASGFHKQQGWESDEQASQRYERMVKGLVAGVNKQHADVIALQETTPALLVPHLKKYLPNGWEIIVDEVGLITCFNGNRFQLKEKTLDVARRISSLELMDNTNNETVNVHNVWGAFDPYPHRMEAHFRNLLENTHSTIIIGDTNSRIAPVDNVPRNIATGIVPIRFNELNDAPPNYQITDHPDGAFYRSAGKDRRIHQPAVHTLNYATGEIVVDERSAEQLQPWPESRMLLCLADHYQQRKIINGQTIFEYEQTLKTLSNEDVVVRMASDSFNRKSLGIRFDPNSSLYKYLVPLMKVSGFQHRFVETTSLEDGGRLYPTIFVPIEHLALLHMNIASYQPPLKVSAQVPPAAKVRIPLNKQLVSAVLNGDLDFIKKYCANGTNKEKFIEVMTLGVDENNRHPNDKGKSALLIAAKNNKQEVLDFIIQTAIQDREAKKLLAAQFLQKTQEGRNVLQDAATNPDNERTIQLLCQTAKQLSGAVDAPPELSKYVNLKDDTLGGTALHFAARQAHFVIYAALVREGADTKSQNEKGMIPAQLVSYAEPKVAAPFMEKWIQQTPEGASKFKDRHGAHHSDISPTLLTELIKIDLDIDVKDQSKAQLSAFKNCMRLLAQTPANKEIDLRAILSNIGAINFAMIRAEDIQNDGSGSAQLIQTIMKQAKAIESEDVKNVYFRAEVLRQIKGFTEANKEAFDNYGLGLLLKQYPLLALNGIKQLDIQSLNPLTVAKRIVVALANMKLNDIQLHPTKKSIFSTFGKDVDKFAKETITRFLEDLHNVVSVNDVQALIMKLPNDPVIASFKQSLLSELQNEKLIQAPFAEKRM